MTDTKAISADPSARYDHVERLLNDYPNLDEQQLCDLKRWFGKEASALDVANLASRHPAGYEQFRADHVDGIKAWEMAGIAILVIAIAAGVAVFA